MSIMVENSVAAPPLIARAASEAPADFGPSELVIRPRRGWIGVDWAELRQFRELLYFLVWRDVKVRYKQTALGVAWAVLVPLFSMLIFTVIFGNFAGMKGQLPSGTSYAVFVYAGLLPWTLFATSLNTGGTSLVNQQSILSKIYFPRLFVPAAVVGGALVDMAISFGVMGSLMIWYHVVPTWSLLLLIPLMFLLVLASLGVAFGFSALTLSYRDFRFVLQFIVQAWMYLSPVIYPVGVVPARYRWILALNPMSGIIDGFRYALMGRSQPLPTLNLAISTIASIAYFIFGLFYFRKTERRIADIA
jgi:lipopolysaccharide transport system permease protein